MKFTLLIACLLGASLVNSYRLATSAGFAPSSATFDGVSDRIVFSTVSLADGAVITISFWFNCDVASGSQYVLMGRAGTSGSLWAVWVGNNVQFSFRNSANVEVVNAYGNGGLATGWHQVLISINTAAQANTRLYVDGVNFLNAYNIFTAASTLDLTQTNLYVGADDDNSLEFAGCLSEVWIDDVYTDFSNSTNRAKFYTVATGDPVNLGSDGSTPFGAAPDVYLKFVSGSLGVNSGADGGTGSVQNNVTDGDCGAVNN